MSRRLRSQALEKVNLLELAPVRRAQWEEVSSRVVITRPKPAASGLRGLGEWLRYWLAMRHIRLDERGSMVWQMLDGSVSVAEVAAALRDRFGDSVEPAEERVGQLVRMLHNEELITYPGWDGEVGEGC